MRLFPSTQESSAVFSPCRVWRYELHRSWDDGEGVAFLMFNPSTADETVNDPTIRKCIGFAKRWGYGRLVIVNLFGIRGSDPRVVGRVSDPVGPLNDYHILQAIQGCDEVICAWGCGGHMRGKLANRPGEVLSLIEGKLFSKPLKALGYSAEGSPRHPLMLAYTTPREDMRWAVAPETKEEGR